MWAVLHKRKLSSSQIILFGFAGVILWAHCCCFCRLPQTAAKALPFGTLYLHPPQLSA